MHFTLTTRAAPYQVREALTDFSARRLETWSQTLDPATYDARVVGETWAVAKESTPRSPYWVVCKYDWSDPAVVRWTMTETSWGGGGSGSVRADPVDGGSRVDVEWTFTGITSPRDRVLLPLFQAWPMNRVVAGMWKKALDRFAG